MIFEKFFIIATVVAFVLILIVATTILIPTESGPGFQSDDASVIYIGVYKHDIIYFHGMPCVVSEYHIVTCDWSQYNGD